MNSMIGPKVKFVLTYIFLKKTHFRWYSDPLKIPIIHATLQHTLMANLPSISIHPIIYVYCLCSMFIKSVSTKYMYYILLDWLNFDHQHTYIVFYSLLILVMKKAWIWACKSEALYTTVCLKWEDNYKTYEKNGLETCLHL